MHNIRRPSRSWSLSSPLLLLTIALLTQLTTVALGVTYDADSFPNPTTRDGSTKCGLRSIGNLCDPDMILNEAERYRLNVSLRVSN